MSRFVSASRVRLFQCRLGLANVRPEHRAFYRKVFLQEPLGEPRLFPGLTKPVGLVAAHYPAICATGVSAVPLYAFERVRASGAVPAPGEGVMRRHLRNLVRPRVDRPDS